MPRDGSDRPRDAAYYGICRGSVDPGPTLWAQGPLWAQDLPRAHLLVEVRLDNVGGSWDPPHYLGLSLANLEQFGVPMGLDNVGSPRTPPHNLSFSLWILCHGLHYLAFWPIWRPIGAR